MHHVMIKGLVFKIAAALFCFWTACLIRPVFSAHVAAATTRQVTDTYGRTITVPHEIQRIVCIPCPAYERIVMLGGKKKICDVRKDMKTNYPLAALTNPDVILIDNTGNRPGTVIAGIRNHPDWQAINAVRSGRIHRMPVGVFYLDKCSTQPVFLLWLAKRLAPQRFSDINMVHELQRYFKTFYQYNLTSSDARRALAGWERSVKK